MDFTPIETQEAFDAAVQARIDANTQSVQAQYQGWISPEDQKKMTAEIDTLKASVADLTAKNQAYAAGELRLKIAGEHGIPFELAGKLSGTTEEEIRKDAAVMVKFIRASAPTPKFSSEKPISDSDVQDAALKATLSRLRK